MKLYVVEHKTSSEDIGFGSPYWKRLTLDSQVTTYIHGARELGHEPDGVLYDVLRKPTLRPLEANKRRSAPESPEEYRDRILEDIAERPDYYYQRGVVVRLEHEESEAAFDTWQTAEQIRLARNAECWPRNVDACVQYGRACDYWPICSGETTPEDRLRYELTEPHRELDTRSHLPLLTVSSMRAFRSCPRKYFHAYEHGLKAREQAGALRFGKLVHQGLEAWFTTSGDLDAALRALGDGSLDYERAKADAMLRGYHARWSAQSFEPVAVEVEFHTALVNPETGAKSRTFLRAGRIDAIARFAE